MKLPRLARRRVTLQKGLQSIICRSLMLNENQMEHLSGLLVVK